jgi:hypothetical protein
MEPNAEFAKFLESITGTLDGYTTAQKSMQKQIDAIDLRIADRATGGPVGENYVEKTMKENEGLQRLHRDRKGNAIVRFEDKAVAQLMTKTTMTSTANGFMTTGVMPIDRIPGITPEARQEMTIRDVLASRPTSMALVDYVKVTTPMTIASPVPEASTSLKTNWSSLRSRRKSGQLQHSFQPANNSWTTCRS